LPPRGAAEGLKANDRSRSFLEVRDKEVDVLTGEAHSRRNGSTAGVGERREDVSTFDVEDEFAGTLRVDKPGIEPIPFAYRAWAA